jgi:signal transduction histidine kinase
VEVSLSGSSRGEAASFTLVVRDFGAGIAPADLPRVFDAFFTTGRGRGGSGLGLAIVHNLVTVALTGTIHIESKPGLGTTVAVTFPQHVPEEGQGRPLAMTGGCLDD